MSARILDRLAQMAPDAVPIFQQATQAYDDRNWEAARQGFERTLELAPTFDAALRRLSRVEVQMDMPTQALVHARQAWRSRHRRTNHSALAEALLFTQDEKLACRSAGARAGRSDEPAR